MRDVGDPLEALGRWHQGDGCLVTGVGEPTFGILQLIIVFGLNIWSFRQHG